MFRKLIIMNMVRIWLEYDLVQALVGKNMVTILFSMNIVGKKIS